MYQFVPLNNNPAQSYLATARPDRAFLRYAFPMAKNNPKLKSAPKRKRPRQCDHDRILQNRANKYAEEIFTTTGKCLSKREVAKHFLTELEQQGQDDQTLINHATHKYRYLRQLTLRTIVRRLRKEWGKKS